MSEVNSQTPDSKPNVYFIDDSATMREVVKIAFRRENFNVVTCSDMAGAVARFEETPPDAVISDVIMPDKDGYQLCEFIKQHPRFGAIPVFLMSGVVNKEVAERAHEVKADELIRKPFHPQDLVARVKKLLDHTEQGVAQASEQSSASPLSKFFEGAAGSFLKSNAPAPAPNRVVSQPVAAPAAARAAAATSQELQKLRVEVKRLESLVKKLQNELASEREYSASLESQLQTISTAG